MNSDDSISRWLELAKAGDRDAQQAIWDQFFPQLVGLARKRLTGGARRAADEEDVVLSVMKSFFLGARENKFPDLRGGDSLWRLLSWMTHRKAVDWLRRESRQKRQSVGESAMPESPDKGMAGVESPDPSPELSVILAEECQRLLNCLKPHLQQVALLKLSQYTNQEIADRQQCSLATIERQLKLIREIWSNQ